MEKQALDGVLEFNILSAKLRHGDSLLLELSNSFLGDSPYISQKFGALKSCEFIDNPSLSFYI